MRVYHFSEQSYPAAWGASSQSLRVSLPNAHCDPEIAADLYERYIDEWQAADELGIDIMVNEHHATATCMSPSCTVTMGILARQTKKARILALGVPLANRPDPMRVAEELAMVDVISRGRLEMGLVRGVPYEIAPMNSNPVRMMDRFWEAHDLVIKAMTTRDGPFSWQGEYFNYRSVNIWPRPFQQPHPPVWITTASPFGARAVAEKGYVVATILSGWRTRSIYDSYRQVWAAAGRGVAPADRFAYCGYISVASSRAEAYRRADIILEQLRKAPVVAEQYTNPPGYGRAEDNARALRTAASGGGGSINAGVHFHTATKDGRSVSMLDGSVEDLIKSAVLFAGAPDDVYEQIADFADACGGLGHVIGQFQGGALSHADTIDNLTLFSREVLPRLKEHSVAEKWSFVA